MVGSMQYKALFLDLDNTIVNSNLAYLNALKSLFKSYSFLNFDLYNASRLIVKKRMPKHDTSARNRAIYFKVMLERIGMFSPKLMEKILDHYESMLYMDIHNQVHSLSRRSLLEKLSSILPIAVITNENLRTQIIKLKAIDPESRFFNAIITSEEAGYEKPHKRIFELSLEAMGCKPEESFMVGDSLECDIIPSKNIGMNAVLTREFDYSVGQEFSGFCIKKLDEIVPLVTVG